MIVHVNGAEHAVEEGATVAAIVELVGRERPRRGVAVAVGAEVVPRGEWDTRELREGERIEILTAVQGG